MSDLAWLDFRRSVNQLRSIRDNPRRLVLYLVLGGLFLAGQANGLVQASRPGPPVFGAFIIDVAPRLQILGPGLGVLLLAWLMLGQGDRPAAAFASPADARFLIGAGISPRVVMAWLVVRTVRQVVLITLMVLLVTTFVYAPMLGITAAAGASAGVGVLAWFSIGWAARISGFLVARRLGFPLVTAMGYVLLALGAATLAVAAAQEASVSIFPAGLAGKLDALPPGAWLVAAVGGDAGALFLMLATAAAFGSAAVLLADDCFPELWTASTRVFDYRGALRAAGGGGLAALFQARRALRADDTTRARETRSSDGRFAPKDPWILAWKEWRRLRHSSAGGWGRLGVAVLAGGAGGAAGVLVKGPSGPAVLGATIGLFFMLMVVGAMGTVELTRDLRNPLWWLSGSPLVQRLAVWTASRTLASTFPFSLFVAGLAVTGPDLGGVLLPGVGLVFLLGWLLQLIGLVGFTLLPAQTDARLNQLVRLGLVYLVLIVLAIPAGVVGVVTHSLTGAVVGAVIAALPMTAGGLVLATVRIGNDSQALVRESAL